MRRLLPTALATALAAGLLAATAVPALAHPTVELAPTLPTDLTHARTDNVDYLGRFPEHTGTAGGRLVGSTFFITDPRGVHAYDVSDPANPTLLDSLALYQNGTGAALAQEDPDTDGRILVVDAAPSPGASNSLQVVDVSDPSDLSVIGTLGVTDHTWNCVTDPRTLPEAAATPAGADAPSCDFVYGRTGHIVDLRDPANPVELPTTWRTSVGYGSTSNTPYTHDLTQIRPGLVLTSGAENILMDTTDPAAPVYLQSMGDRRRFSSTGLGFHSVEWANGGADPFVVAGTEIAPGNTATSSAGSDCKGDESVIETWDASAVVAALDAYDGTNPQVFEGAEFVKRDAFDVGGRGIFLTGNAPGHLLYCAHWMELHPDFDGGGKVAVSYYDRGTRFLEVAADGTMSEIGWMVPAEGYSGSPQWIGSDGQGDIVYVMDYRRGLEVLRLRPQEASTVIDQTVDVLAAGSTGILPAPAPTDHRGSVPASSLVALAVAGALGGVELARRRRTA